MHDRRVHSRYEGLAGLCHCAIVEGVGAGDSAIWRQIGVDREAIVEDGGTDEEGPLAVSAAALTTREREVLHLLAAGASNKAIARRLNVSVHTAQFYVASFFRKLGAGSRLEAVGVGLRNGLLML